MIAQATRSLFSETILIIQILDLSHDFMIKSLIKLNLDSMHAAEQLSELRERSWG